MSPRVLLATMLALIARVGHSFFLLRPSFSLPLRDGQGSCDSVAAWKTHDGRVERVSPHFSQSSHLFQSRDWIDEVHDDERLDKDDSQPPVKPDMKYLPRNVMRQHQNFVAIREAAGKELTNDLYVREPDRTSDLDPESSTFWFVGKVARISDVTPAQAVRRQWNLIETHAANLRPMELFPSRGSLEIWMAPGDSEMEVAYNKPNVMFQKIKRYDNDNDLTTTIKNSFVGFQGEMYEGGEQGFRTWRRKDGSPAKPEVSSPNASELRAPSDREMQHISSMLEGKDINQVYKEQQRRAGKPVDDDDDDED